MKKLILTSFAVFASFAFMNAQNIADNAIGLRIGDNDGLGTEISYQRALGDNNRLEVDLGWRSRSSINAFQLTGLYQWVWQLDGDFNWYAGVGGGVGSVSFDNSNIDSETFIFAAGDIGIEYSFDFPLLLSLDFRPEFGFGDYRDDLDFDIALGVRYQF
ncbi:hypothetical protein [uncultured Winogradskyella sp.]|uniref:hypothetical protein n=1 Tax=uncultured Winogradskyella sp. TaxID=395353 RepID=UPI00260D3904|nr:hypothetical protein [uncultured Winogradskyella sp.]